MATSSISPREADPGPAPGEESPGLYLHLPFCSAICPYCDFTVVTGSRRRRARFVAELVREIELYAGHPFTFDTVYLGGGTPSALEDDELEVLLQALDRHLEIAPGCRVFLEANPEDVTRHRLDAWRRLGVETLSLGVQSFDAVALRFLGRRHSPDEARRAVVQALEAGFATVSVDLIYGLPESTGLGRNDWLRTLEVAVALAPDHLSCYELTVHEGTAFGRKKRRGELDELAPEPQARLFHDTHTRLAEAGYDGYEVSNFARCPEHRSRHNQKYWHHTPYLGLGPGAHSFDGRRRWWNETSLDAYEAKTSRGQVPVAGGETLSRDALALEALLLGLRTRKGVDLAAFENRFGLDVARRNRVLLQELRRDDLLEKPPGGLVPTLKGLALADWLATRFELGE